MLVAEITKTLVAPALRTMPWLIAGGFLIDATRLRPARRLVNFFSGTHPNRSFVKAGNLSISCLLIIDMSLCSSEISVTEDQNKLWLLLDRRLQLLLLCQTCLSECACRLHQYLQTICLCFYPRCNLLTFYFAPAAT